MTSQSVPDLGVLSQPLPRLSTNPFSLIRALDDEGTFAAAAVKIGPDGQPMVQVGRASYVDAQELVELICMALRPLVGLAVRAELERMGLVAPDE